jgi:hypothetical protein
MRQHFSLIPLRDPKVPDITIEGNILRQNNLFSIHFALTGKVEDILFPIPTINPMRKDALWKNTCFEFFLAVKYSPQYWEFNMSPSGDWNAYHIEAYRRIGFREEILIQQLPFQVQKDVNGLVLDAFVDLNPIIQVKQDLEIGITTIIETKDGNETYWALVHPAPQADFHLRESFILGMAG